MTEIVAHIDGAARGNPGPAAYAVVMETTGGAPVAAFAKFLGETTNNVAEYQGLLAALDYALNHRCACRIRRLRARVPPGSSGRCSCSVWRARLAGLHLAVCIFLPRHLGVCKNVPTEEGAVHR